MLRFIKRALLSLLAIIVVVGAVLVATAPGSLDYSPPMPTINENLDGWLAANEAAVHARTPIIADTEKRIRWHGEPNQRTPLAVVYLHGFSATRQEVAPVGELVADALGANLFETRLAGHGLESDPLSDVRAEDWLDDGVEALALGASIGDKIVLMGTSTGATLAVALADHESFDAVTTLVLMSPNFGLPDPSSEALTWPGGPQLANAMIGDTRSWTAANDLQDRFWSTTYPTASLVEMMRLVKRSRTLLATPLEASVLTLYSPNDGVVDTSWVQKAAGQINSAHSELIAIEESGDPSNHVLAGNILSPESNAAIAAHITDFVRGNVSR